MAQPASPDTIFCAAIEIADEDERAAYLARSCGDDQELRARVEKLLAAHFRAGSFLERACKFFCVSWVGRGVCFSVFAAWRQAVLEHDREVVQRCFPAHDRHRPPL